MKKYQIKAIKRLTKNGKEVIKPIIVNTEDDRDVFFLNDGFSVTLTLDESELNSLLESGKLYNAFRKKTVSSGTEQVI